jgi:hypothetical protein
MKSSPLARHACLGSSGLRRQASYRREPVTGRAACAPALPGPVGSGEGSEDKAPPGGMGMDAHAFSSGQDALSKSPAGPSRTWLACMPAKRTRRGALSLGYFSLGKQRKVTRSRQGPKAPQAMPATRKCGHIAQCGFALPSACAEASPRTRLPNGKKQLKDASNLSHNPV